MTPATQQPALAREPDRPEWLPAAIFPFQSRFTDIDGTIIHYLDVGAGPALLLVSAGQWSFMFRDVISRLSGTFRCVTLDFPASGLSPQARGHDHSVLANASLLDGFIDALDLQDLTMVVHDVGGPIGFLSATRRPGRFRGLVISNTFGWPLAGYPAVRRMLALVRSPVFGAVNNVTNLMALVTATSYGIGRHLSRADRRAFLGPWRSRGCRTATQQVVGGAREIDPIMAQLERDLPTKLGGLPVLTLFGCRNDPYGWQQRFGTMFPLVTEAGIPDGHHFPFSDDPDAYCASIRAWWTEHVALGAADPAPAAERTETR